MTRRLFLLLAALLLGLDFGVSHFMGRSVVPPGWKTERWQAGFGSWGFGGHGLAYDISIPPDYAFTQKCGTALITSGDDNADFIIKLYFVTSQKDKDTDFDEYMKTDAQQAASDFGSSPNDIEMGNAMDFNVAAVRFSRVNLSMKNAHLDPDRDEVSAIGTVRAFHLKSEKVGIIANFGSPKHFAVNERIVRSMSRVRGFGLIDLLVRGIPNLLGC